LSSPFAIKPLYNKLDDCLSADKFRLKRRITQLAQKVNDTSGVEGKGAEKKAANPKASKRDIAVSEESLKAQFEKLEGDIDASIEKRKWRKDNLPKVEYPPLPVSDKKEDIKEAIANNQVVIVAGETGSGKTTQLPKICLNSGGDPRRYRPKKPVC